MKGANIEFKDTNDDGGVISTGDAEETVKRFSIDAVGFWPMNENFFGLGKIGYGKNTFSLDVNDFEDVKSNSVH